MIKRKLKKLHEILAENPYYVFEKCKEFFNNEKIAYVKSLSSKAPEGEI